MGKRGQNEGTIYRRKNGGWCAQVKVSGKRLTKYGKTRSECRTWLTTMLSKLEQGLPVHTSRASVAQYLDHWLDITRTTVRPNTHDQYRRIIARHIIPCLGHVRLTQLRPDHIQKLYSDKLEQGLGVRSTQIIHSILHRALGQAVKWDLLARNPASAVEKPKQQRREIQYLNTDQARRFLAAARDSRYHALFHLAITTGLRQAELLGLRWSDLDHESGALQVQRQLYRETGRGLVFREPKTATGRRVITLSRNDLSILANHRKQQLAERLFVGPHWIDHDLIFSTRTGTPIDQRNMTREFKRVLGESGLPLIRFHDLRHTAASLMLQTGIHPKIVQERLGHADIALTLNTYSHVLPTLQREAAETLAALLS